METHTLALEQFPAHPEAGRETAESITRCLDDLFREQGLVPGESLRIPPLLDLATFFRCPHLEVYDAFQKLRKQGYDYEISGLDDPVLFWIGKGGSKGKENPA